MDKLVHKLILKKLRGVHKAQFSKWQNLLKNIITKNFIRVRSSDGIFVKDSNFLI